MLKKMVLKSFWSMSKKDGSVLVVGEWFVSITKYVTPVGQTLKNNKASYSCQNLGRRENSTWKWRKDKFWIIHYELELDFGEAETIVFARKANSIGHSFAGSSSSHRWIFYCNIQHSRDLDRNNHRISFGISGCSKNLDWCCCHSFWVPLVPWQNTLF